MGKETLKFGYKTFSGFNFPNLGFTEAKERKISQLIPTWVQTKVCLFIF